jgi:hypothetical protein
MLPARGFADGVEVAFVAGQTVVVLFLLVHDWVPLGRLNNLAAIRSQDSFGKRVFVTLLPSVPAGICLWFSVKLFGRPYPERLEITLWITYGLFLLGLPQAWWIAYLFGTDPKRAERYQMIFAGTHTFLPRRYGMAPDTLHTVFHAVVILTVVLLILKGLGV